MNLISSIFCDHIEITFVWPTEIKKCLWAILYYLGLLNGKYMSYRIHVNVKSASTMADSLINVDRYQPRALVSSNQNVILPKVEVGEWKPQLNTPPFPHFPNKTNAESPMHNFFTYYISENIILNHSVYREQSSEWDCEIPSISEVGLLYNYLSKSMIHFNNDFWLVKMLS